MLTRHTKDSGSQVGTGDSYPLSFCTMARPMVSGGSIGSPAWPFHRIRSSPRAYQMFVLVLPQGAATVLEPKTHHTTALQSRILPSLLRLASQYRLCAGKQFTEPGRGTAHMQRCASGSATLALHAPGRTTAKGNTGRARSVYFGSIPICRGCSAAS